MGWYAVTIDNLKGRLTCLSRNSHNGLLYSSITQLLVKAHLAHEHTLYDWALLSGCAVKHFKLLINKIIWEILHEWLHFKLLVIINYIWRYYEGTLKPMGFTPFHCYTHYILHPYILIYNYNTWKPILG